ncbi:hypothetical protein CsSME_00015939 [Camellia sinensis var. sinensis]
MSGARLCALLGELGFQGHDTLDPDSFEWPFQYDDARPILDWLCSSLRPSNVLSLSDLYHNFYKKESYWRGKTWILLMIAYQPFQLGETTRRQFLELKKD